MRAGSWQTSAARVSDAQIAIARGQVQTTWAHHSGWETDGGNCWHSTGKGALQNHADFEETDSRSSMFEGATTVQNNMRTMAMDFSGQPSWSAYPGRKHHLSVAPRDTLGDNYDPKAFNPATVTRARP